MITARAAGRTATALIERAEAQAVELTAGVTTLEGLATTVRLLVVGQAVLGEWADAGIKNGDEMTGLRVSARMGNPLATEPRVVIEYDFSRTARPMLLVKRTVGN